MNLKELYFSHTLKNPDCPICNSHLPSNKNSKRCSCGFQKWSSGFNIYFDNFTYIFDISHNVYKRLDNLSISRTPITIDLSNFYSYNDLINHILKLEVFQ